MVGLFGSTVMPGEKPCGFVRSWNSRSPIVRTSFSTASFSPDVALRMFAVSRSTWARSTLSSFQESRAARSTKSRSSWLRGRKSAVQASIRPVNAAPSSPGRTSNLAVMPCVTPLNRERSFPSAVRGPVLF